ncbi:MAG: serine-type D-Ala-D-Ala carboxypeptidase [Gammaproteobacteria bacterium]|jgi:D-alanyl-D-alanine carboxypeptidase (penicillin-binding protein 5/6)|nr:serine-type D-Ala-D-Ala carboxypeptidase [Gammaproteobacteria bacterium]|tara:strand:- start:13634 stop:14797 length:1164 start_codon:yes stop_codon:yes gene_type:complete
MCRLLTLFFILAIPCTLFAAPPIIPAPPQLAAQGYLLIDAATGTVLVEHNSKQRLPPASLTKIMTSFVAASEIERGTASLKDSVNVSVKAWRMEGSRMFIQESTRVLVQDLLRGIVVQSGNDASVALAEHLAGSEEAFVNIMNQQASRLGMVDTNFANSTGLPDENHYTTASDLARLTVALIEKYPEHYKLYSEKYFTYNNIRQPNRNSLLWRDNTVDGVKTGHTDAAGYCLIASAVRDGMRLVSVVMGTQSEEARSTESQKLMTYGFRYFETVSLYSGNETLKKVRVWGGSHSSINVGLVNDVVVTIGRGARDSLAAHMDITNEIYAPLSEGQELGILSVKMNEEVLLSPKLVALNAVEQAGFFSRAWDEIELFFLKLFDGDPLEI